MNPVSLLPHLVFLLLTLCSVSRMDMKFWHSTVITASLSMFLWYIFLSCTVTWEQYDLDVDFIWNVMAHTQKPDLVFWRNGRVHWNRQGRQFSRLLAAEMCASALVMLDIPCSEVVWRVLATHSIRQFPLHFASHASPCAIMFQLDSTMFRARLILDIHSLCYKNYKAVVMNTQGSVRPDWLTLGSNSYGPDAPRPYKRALCAP